MKKYYKVLDESGKSCSGGDFQWSLPTQDDDGNWIPGEWHEHDGDVILCVSGFHLTDDPHIWSDNNTVVYECEIADDAIVSEYDDIDCKIAVSKVRLTKLFTGVLHMNFNEQHYANGKLHRDDDLPAMISDNGDRYWYQNGKLHRDNDLPALIYSDGDQCWYQNGKLHRDNDLPAVVYGDGHQEWYQNGLKHRDNDLPAVVLANGDQCWCQNGKFHRDNDLPAMIWACGDRHWYQNGFRHRKNDLPAVILADGSKEFWINGAKQ